MMDSGIIEYDFTHKYRGQALIFIQERFDGEKFLPPRNGAKEDMWKMDTLFRALDFKVKVYQDLPRAKILEKLKNAAASRYNKDSDCLACVFSTHGTEEKEKDRKHSFVTWKNCIYGRDCMPMYVDDILEMFNHKNCPDLKDKPKLFFIQACRSRHERQDLSYDLGKVVHIMRQHSRNMDQRGHRDNMDSLDAGDCSQGDHSGTVPIDAVGQMSLADSGSGDECKEIGEFVDIYEDWTEDEDADILKEIPSVGDDDDESEMEAEPETEVDAGASGDINPIPPLPVELTPINCPNDFLVVYPIMPGKKALRSGEGSWLLYFLHKNMFYLLKNNRLLPYLTKVCSNMAEKTFRPRPLNEHILNSADYIQTKATALIIHKLSKDVRFTPKQANTTMAIWHAKLFPGLTMPTKIL